jgi:hypothetical protein
MLAGFRWTDGTGFEFPLRMEHFYRALLGAMITIVSTCRHVARAASVAEPSEPLPWEAWLQPGNDLYPMDVVGFNGLSKEVKDDFGIDYPITGHFPKPVRVRTSRT